MMTIDRPSLTVALALALALVVLPGPAAQAALTSPGTGITPRPNPIKPILELVKAWPCTDDFGQPCLSVTGTSGADDVTIVQDDKLDTLEVYDDGELIASYASSAVPAIYVDLMGGGDSFWYGLSDDIPYPDPYGGSYPDCEHWYYDGPALKYAKHAKVKLGTGGDDAVFDFTPLCWDQALEAKLEIEIVGGSGADDVRAVFGPQRNSKLELVARLGGGDDELDVVLGEQEDSQVELVARLGGGADQAKVEQAKNLLGSADVSLDLRGGGDDDTFIVNKKYGIGEAAAMEIKLTGGPGADNFYPGFYGGTLDGDLELKVKGNAGDDFLSGNLHLGLQSTGLVVTGANCGEGKDKDWGKIFFYGLTPAAPGQLSIAASPLVSCNP